MARTSNRKRATPARKRKAPTAVEYILGKGTSRLLDARVDREEIHLLVNGPAMLYGSCRLLTSLDAADGATFQAWTALCEALSCTSLCGLNGKTDIPIVVHTSRIGTCIEFGTGPMSMYLATVVLRPKKKGITLKRAIDEAFGRPKARYQVVIVPEPATGHLEHDGAIYEPDAFPGNEPQEDHHGGHGHGH
jgi:hypothetical protein